MALSWPDIAGYAQKAHVKIAMGQAIINEQVHPKMALAFPSHWIMNERPSGRTTQVGFYLILVVPLIGKIESIAPGFVPELLQLARLIHCWGGARTAECLLRHWKKSMMVDEWKTPHQEHPLAHHWPSVKSGNLLHSISKNINKRRTR